MPGASPHQHGEEHPENETQPAPAASRPRSGAHMPPTLTASPSVTPEAIPTRRGRYSCPSTTSTLVGMKMKTASGTRTTRARFGR